MKKKLNYLLRRFDDLATEKAKMQADLDRAVATEKRILEDGKITDSEIKALSDSRTMQELIARRIPIAIYALAALGRELNDALRDARADYNRKVCPLIDLEVEKVIDANRVFWPGKLRELKKLIERTPVPSVEAAWKFIATGGFMAQPDAAFHASQTRQFLALVDRASKHFGVDFD